MVEWTNAERKTIAEVWGKLNIEAIGSCVLARCLVVYPWTQRYFANFGNICSTDAIMNNTKVAQHGVTVMRGLEQAVHQMDNIKNIYTALSLLHSDKLHVDSDNFRLFGDALTILIASKLGGEFTPEIQAVWEKFLSVVVSALGRMYH